jgi:SAM-dependent methyltransferase
VATSDRWADWVLHARHGGDPARHAAALAVLGPIRDRILDAAAPAPGETVLDVGCGDGLLGFAALDRVAPAGVVVFSDVSEPLLAHCRGTARGLGVADRCRFVHTGLPELAGVPDGSVDVAVLRSVLMYVRDRPACLRALHRVLRPGGRLSLFEPVNSFGSPEPPDRLWTFDVAQPPEVRELADRVVAAARADRPADDPILDYDERDLLAAAEAAGFAELSLAYEARVGTEVGFGFTRVPIGEMLGIAPNPTSPTYGEMLDRALAPAERDRLVAHLAAQPPERRLARLAVAYLSARRPA